MNNYNQSGKLDCTETTPRFKKSSLASRIAYIMLAGAACSTFMATPAYAQSEDNQQEQPENSASSEGELFEEVLVSGIRQSYTSALDRKRDAGTMMDSLVAEDIGEFPDKNIAEALQRISGIQLERDMGEGTTVSVRGVESGLVRVELNGVTAMGTGGNRSVDFRDMASELVKSVDVYKGSEARLTEGGVGGTIQVQTRKPNEFDENFLSINGEAQYNTMIGDVMPKYNLTGVYKVTDNLGVLVNVTGSDVHTMFHGLRNTDWRKYHDVDGSPQKTSVDQLYADVTDKADCADVDDQLACEQQWYEYSPSTPRYGIWGRDEQRLSANIEVQYSVNDDLSFDVSYTDSSRKRVATDRNFQVEVGSAFNTTDPESYHIDENKNVQRLVTTGRNAAGTPIGATVRNRTLNFDWDQERTVMRAGFDYDTENLVVEGYVARSTTFEDIDARDTQSAQNNVGGIVVQQVNDLPHIDFDGAYVINQDDENDTFNTFNYNDGTQYTSLDRFKYDPSQNDASEDVIKLDVDYMPESGFFTVYRTGFIATDQNFSNNAWGYNLMQTVGNPYTTGDGETRIWTQDDHEAVLVDNRFATDKFFRDYNADVEVIQSYMAIDTEPYLQALLDRSGYSSAVAARDSLDSIDSRYDINVQTQSAYVQADFETEIANMPLRGNFGVRVARTETESEGFSRIRVMVEQTDEDGNPIYGPNGEDLDGVEDPNDPRAFEGRTTISEDFVDVLPSLNLTLEIADGVEAYFGAAKVMARPQITDLNINADCTYRDFPLAENQQTPNTCTAGNPDLDPYRATQAEVALTWYPDDNSIVSGAYFVKDITSYIFGAETQQDVDFFNDGRLWDVQQQVNKQGIRTNGIELQASTFFDFLPGIFSNTGAKANYTYITADNVDDFNPLTGEQMPLRGQSKNSYNLEAFYEDDNWSMKLAYNYRDEYYARVFDGLPVFVEASGYVDGKITYTLNDNLRFYVDARNLTKEAKVETSGPGRTNDLQWSGRIFSAGFTYRM